MQSEAPGQQPSNEPLNENYSGRNAYAKKEEEGLMKLMIIKYIRNKGLIKKPTEDDIKPILSKMNNTRNINKLNNNIIINALRKYVNQISATGMVPKYQIVDKYHKIMTNEQIKSFMTKSNNAPMNQQKLNSEPKLIKRVLEIAQNRRIFNRLNNASKNYLLLQQKTNNTNN